MNESDHTALMAMEQAQQGITPLFVNFEESVESIRARVDAVASRGRKVDVQLADRDLPARVTFVRTTTTGVVLNFGRTYHEAYDYGMIEWMRRSE